MRPWYWLARFLVGTFDKIFFNMRCHGGENVPLTGGLLLASNHLSYLDPPSISVGCPREIHPLARKTLFRHPLGDKLLRSLNVSPVDLTGKADIAGLKYIIGKLQAGKIVLLFPEGTRSPDGNLQPAKAGVGLLVAKGGVPVLPVRLFGFHEAWPRNQKLWSCHQVDIVYGKPVSYEKMIAEAKAQGRGGKELYQQIADDVMKQIAAVQLPEHLKK